MKYGRTGVPQGVRSPVFQVEIIFEGDLSHFLHSSLRGTFPVGRILGEKTSVKDVIEACGAPHPEVDLIALVDESGAPARALDFSFQVATSLTLAVYPVPAPLDVLPLAPRLQSRACDRFVADGHLGALARHLRLLGIDTTYERDADDRRLLEIMTTESRALLTRDRHLLMHSVVHRGYCPRSSDPEEQTREILRRFPASAQAFAMTRCLHCNGILNEVPKQQILEELAHEPRTLRYYDHFLRCPDCGRIYWRGSHFDKLTARLTRLRGDSE